MQTQTSHTPYRILSCLPFETTPPTPEQELASSGRVLEGGLSCSRSPRLLAVSSGTQEPPENPGGLSPPPLPRVTSGSPASCLTWDAQAAFSARSRSRRASGTCPHPAPTPTTPGRRLYASPPRGRPFLRKARGRLLFRGPGFRRLLFRAVAVTRVGPALPEGPLRPMSHGRGPGAPRTLAPCARRPGLRRPRRRALPLVPSRDGVLSARRPRPLRPAHACSVLFALVCGAGFKGRGLEMQSVLFPRPGCAGGRFDVERVRQAPGAECRGESKILSSQELKQTKKIRRGCVFGGKLNSKIYT